ncbi:MAG: hypothetical protein VCD00_01685 [Candidatus Hydrogenedentota bacterium]
MRIGLRIVSMIAVLGCTLAYTAEPTTVEELKEHFKTFGPAPDTFTADYSMSMNMAATGQPQAAAMGEMSMGGTMKVKGETTLMKMKMSMGIEGQGMEMKMDMHQKDNVMTMLIDMGGMTQAMKMDLSVMKELADAMGVPESALNSSNMGMGMMGNPAKMLEQYEQMYSIKLVGKESLNGEDVYVLSATMLDETLENLQKSPMLQGQTDMYENEVKLYLGAKDGVMRKMEMGDVMSMTLENIDLGATISDADLELNIPEGIQVIDMTEMMKGMFGNMAVSGDDSK